MINPLLLFFTTITDYLSEKILTPFLDSLFSSLFTLYVKPHLCCVRSFIAGIVITYAITYIFIARGKFRTVCQGSHRIYEENTTLTVEEIVHKWATDAYPEKGFSEKENLQRIISSIWGGKFGNEIRINLAKQLHMSDKIFHNHLSQEEKEVICVDRENKDKKIHDTINWQNLSKINIEDYYDGIYKVDLNHIDFDQSKPGCANSFLKDYVLSFPISKPNFTKWLHKSNINLPTKWSQK